MASTVSVRIDGLKDLGERMKKVSAEVNDRIGRAATAAGAVVIRNAAQQNVPVDTGNLKKNIIVKRLPKAESQLTSEHIVTVRKEVTKKQKASGIRSAFYGSMVEYGTVRMSARPYMRPAFDRNKDAAVAAVKDRIEKRLKKVGA